MALQLKRFLILPHPLANFEIQKYYPNEPRFNGVYSSDNLPNTTKHEAYVTNYDEYEDVGTHWIALYVSNNEIIYFDSFGVEYIPKEVKIFIKGTIVHKNIKSSILRIQAGNSILTYF